MRLLHCLLVAALLLLPVSPAFAQSMMLEKFQETEPLPPVLTPEEDPKIVRDFSNAYYADCIKSEGKKLLSISRENFCACTSAKIVEGLTAEDLSVMGQPASAEAKKMHVKITNEIYGPCMEKPLRDRAIYDCMVDKQLRAKSAYRPKICNCVADRMVDAWWRSGVPVLLAQLKKENASPDPFVRYLDNRAYSLDWKYHMKNCYYKIEFSR